MIATGIRIQTSGGGDGASTDRSHRCQLGFAVTGVEDWRPLRLTRAPPTCKIAAGNAPFGIMTGSAGDGDAHGGLPACLPPPAAGYCGDGAVTAVTTPPPNATSERAK